MQDQVDLLLQAFAKLREEVEQLQESRLQIEAISTGESARGMALSSIVAEIAEHLGRPEAAIREAFEIRHRHFHQELLQLAELVDPGLSGQLDFRSLEDVPAESGYPPLFP
jgi:hypothetical protein